MRRYRAQGVNGPGAYPQCVPGGSDQPHLLGWAQIDEAPAAPSVHPDTPGLSHSESEVLDDAADGMTVDETAVSRSKSPETVKTQRRSILLKLGAKNMTHAVALVSTRRVRARGAE
ncbi:MAG TPA: helix-turn-helix transcriptional regulator [Gaiellales bacterium]